MNRPLSREELAEINSFLSHTPKIDTLRPFCTIIGRLLDAEAFWREAVKNAKPDTYMEYGVDYPTCPFCGEEADCTLEDRSALDGSPQARLPLAASAGAVMSDYVTRQKAKNLFYVKPEGPQDWREINEWISTYGGSAKTIDFIGNSDRTLELLWELVTAKCGCVTFEYTIGACLVTGGGKHGAPEVKASGDTIGRALANLFLEYMRREAAR